MTPAGIEPATFQFVAQRLNHCAIAVPKSCMKTEEIRSSSVYMCARNHYEVRNDQNFLSVVVAETKPGFTLKTQNPTAGPTVEKPILSTCKESPESQVKHEEHVSGYFFCEGIVHPVFVPPGQLVNWRCYICQSKYNKNVRSVVKTVLVAHTAF